MYRTATRAYKSALFTLSNLTAHPPSHTHDVFSRLTTTTPSLLSALLPDPQGQGPVGSAIRIALKLRQQFFLFRLFSGPSGSAARRKDEEMRGKAIKVLDLLQHSVELGNPDALFTLGQISLFPPSSHFPSDPKLAYDSFSHHAELTGNASSQALLAFFHATGYADVVPVDQAQALLYYTFSAQGGHKGAQMALGYRYWSGISTVEDCGRAVEWYEAAADEAMSMFLSCPPDGLTLPLTATRLSDLDGGVFGPGASVASTGLNVIRPAVKAGLAHTAGETWDDVLEYYIFNADRGEIDFAFKLGKIYYQGSIYATPGGIRSGSEGVGRVPQDFHQAQSYFLQIARQIWPRDPANPLQHNAPSYKVEGVKQPGYAAKSAAYLGRMYLRGEGVKQDYAMAMMWFERGAEFDERECLNMLGVMWRDGLVPGRQDMKKAVEHFNRAAGQELADAHVNLGKFNYYRGEFKLAIVYLETAVRFGATFEAHFYLAKIHAMNMHDANEDFAAGFCASAVSFFKLVAERGVWDDDLLTDAEAAWYSGTERGKEIAILKWWVAAERGSEMAQNNLAYVLDQDRSMLRLTRFAPIEASNDTALLALTQWTRSAAQRNVDALVKVGDYYYHGLGVPDEPEALRWEKAAKYYQSAADTQVSALAMWNLGWMYENGVGVPQDFHLAKRHYDMALEANSEAYVPVVLSLMKLYARSLWYTLQGGKDGLNLWTYDEDKLSVAERTRLKREIEGGSKDAPQKDGGAQPAMHKEERALEEFEDDGSAWYLGKAREEFHRRTQGRAGRAAAAAEDDDPVQWARERRNAENERDGDFGPEDYFDGAIRGGNRGEEEEDEFAETMLLVALCAAVAVLIYVRTRIVERARRREQEQQPNQRDLGAFPPPGDPARQEWNIMH
ncbi:HCP-like protein [Rhizopogon vinicolor AM-OR11-026]|uniref:HCP-like protein n=1 Tax=Rhizopogon vinicolor AM-OR11-026 TaxID=1314800 RepID=A0A1B7NFX1_9AGAM|nr:HCP-like protein [Rhizopogon vinicolor AM-OR11-026]